MTQKFSIQNQTLKTLKTKMLKIKSAYLRDSQEAQKHEDGATGEHDDAGGVERRLGRLERLGRCPNPGGALGRRRRRAAGRVRRRQQRRRNLHLPGAVVQRPRRQRRRLRVDARKANRVGRGPRGQPPPVRNRHRGPLTATVGHLNLREYFFQLTAADGDADTVRILPDEGKSESDSRCYIFVLLAAYVLKGIPLLVPLLPSFYRVSTLHGNTTHTHTTSSLPLPVRAMCD